jgi:gamma-glutamyltranspeptidase
VAFDKIVLYLQLVPHGSVATDSAVCSLVGTDIMKIGGNAVDAAIAAIVCLGVVNLHVTGLGG